MLKGFCFGSASWDWDIAFFLFLSFLPFLLSFCSPLLARSKGTFAVQFPKQQGHSSLLRQARVCPSKKYL